MKITDEMLYRHAAEARDIWLDTLPDDNEIPEHQFSDEFNKEMDRLITLSHKRKQPSRRLQRIAAMFAVIIIGASSFIGVNAEARAAFIGWVKELTSEFLVYRYEGDPVATDDPEKIPVDPITDVHYGLASIPEGYIEILADYDDNGGSQLFENEAGQYLTFLYTLNSGDSSMYIDTTSTAHYRTLFNGHEADVLISDDPTIQSSVAWVDDENTVFCVMGFFDADGLFEIAESIEPIAMETTTPDLGSLNYQPTLLPEGYTWHRENDIAGSRLIYYKNEAGQQLRYHYVYDTTSSTMFTVAEGGTHSIIDIKGYQADMLLFDDPETSSCILWTDENNCIHAVHAFLDEEELIELAESVKIVD